MKKFKGILCLVLALVLCFSFVGASFAATTGHVTVTKQVVKYYEESKIGLHGWQCESTTTTNGVIDWNVYTNPNSAGYYNTSTTTQTAIYEGIFHRWYWKTIKYTYYDSRNLYLPFH
jgi:hypothetical protein